MAKEVTKEVHMVFDKVMKSLDSKNFPFYHAFLEAPMKRNSGNILFDNIFAFADDLNLTDSDIVLLKAKRTEFIKLAVMSAVKRKDVLSEEDKLSKLKVWGFDVARYPKLSAVLLKEWEATSRLTEICPKEDTHKLFYSGITVCENIILRFGLAGLVRLAELVDKRSVLELFKFGFPADESLILDLGLEGFLKLAESCSKECVFFLFMYGFSAGKHLIKSKENLMVIGDILIRLIEACPKDKEFAVLANLQNFQHLINSENDLFEVGTILIAIAKDCDKDFSYAVINYGFRACGSLIKDKERLLVAGEELVSLAKACPKKRVDGIFCFGLSRCRPLIEKFGPGSLINIVKKSGVYAKQALGDFVPLFMKHVLSGRFRWSDAEGFILKFLDSPWHMAAFRFIPKDELERCIVMLDYSDLHMRCATLLDDKRYWTCEGLNELGFLCCHMTNAFGGGAALTEGEVERKDAFKNIITCLLNQGKNKFQLSISTISPDTKNTLAELSPFALSSDEGIIGCVGVVLDSGFIYEAYAGDASSYTKLNSSKDFSFRSGPSGSRVDPVFAVKFCKEHYNELLVRRWTVGGLFYSKMVKSEVVEQLKSISDSYSFRKYPNPAYISRKVAFGVPKEIEKVYHIYELDLNSKSWKIVYTPKKKN
jgi:hypothetical protein